MTARRNKIVIPVEVELSELNVFDLERDDLFAFICAIDDRIADYEFTERLRDHFAEIIRKEDEAEARRTAK